MMLWNYREDTFMLYISAHLELCEQTLMKFETLTERVRLRKD